MSSIPVVGINKKVGDRLRDFGGVLNKAVGKSVKEKKVSAIRIVVSAFVCRA